MTDATREPLYPPPGNPFPGIDPWMQRHWPKFHARLVADAEGRLQPQLPDDLRADGEARTFITRDGLRLRRTGPDDAIIEQPPTGAGRAGAGVAVLDPATAAKPVIVSIPPVEERQRYLQIVDINDERVVTVIEFLSPTNKRRGTPRRAYLRKQRECLAAGVNVVEIDLTRGGRRPMIGPPPDADRVTLAANVWRADAPDQTEFYPLALRDPLPNLRVPLRPADADVLLELQPMIDGAFVKGAAHKLDHARPLDPPLSADDAAWARERIDAARARTAPSTAGG